MQNDEWAAKNLQVIRTLMEGSALYRRALAPVMSVVGITGIVAGIMGAALDLETSRCFILYWIAVALVCLTEAFLMIRRQAFRNLEPFWSSPTRRVARAVSPALSAGLVVGVVFLMLPAADRQSVLARQDDLLLIPIWMVLYGLAMHAAGFFIPPRFQIFGWGFVWCGLVLLVCLISFSNSAVVLPDFPWANTAMGGLFGGGHVAYGFYLYFTEKRGNVV